jgi:ATPases involved in chromosome partitioning
MSAPVVAFFNAKSGAGATSLVYHAAWMMARRGLRVVAADLDPQADLTASFLEEDTLGRLWPTGGAPAPPGRTVYDSLAPLLQGSGDVDRAPLVDVDDRLSLVPGDLALSTFEDEFSRQWSGCLDGEERAFRVISAFWRLLAGAARSAEADVVLVDVGPNLGATSRAVLVAADHVVIPVSPDLFDVRGLQIVGPRLRSWREEWNARVPNNPDPTLELPAGTMRPIGYVLLRHGVRLDRPISAYEYWLARIPDAYRAAVLDLHEPAPPINSDPYCLAQIRNLRSLLSLFSEARKPIFALKPADGAFGGHRQAIMDTAADFGTLTDRIATEVGVRVPTIQQ